MRYRIHQIKLEPDEEQAVIPRKIRRRLHRPDLVIDDWQIVRESIDARDHRHLMLVYSVDFTSRQQVACAEAPDLHYRLPRPRRREMPRPVVVGFGPCGIFAALVLAEIGLAPIVIERGRRVAERDRDVRAFWERGRLDPESNVQFGEGGAGTFSDGKLTTGIHDYRVRKVLEELAAAGGGEEILYRHRPHIGTDRLRQVVPRLRAKVLAAGGEIRFGTRLDGLGVRDGRLREAILSDGTRLRTDDLILAAGHSARDTFEMLAAAGIEMTQKPFSMGVRIEHPQRLINLARYGSEEAAARLGPADYRLSWHCADGRGVYTFCMCPGGEVIVASSEPGCLVINGMSDHSRSGKFANSALLAEVRPEDLSSSDPLAGVALQRRCEQQAFAGAGQRYRPLRCTWGEFADSTAAACLPDFAVSAICEAMPHLGQRLRGFDDPRARLYGIETRSSSPVRIVRDRRLMSPSLEGFYPAGEGAGYAGGIVSAAVDGLRAAEAVAEREGDYDLNQ
jgi:uncharacterized FAD-dependent dehydrogenase